MYLEDMDDDHKNVVERMKLELQELKEGQKKELESLLLESENLQIIHEKEKTELTQRFQDMVQDLRKRDEEVIKIQMLESSNKKDDEFSKIENVRVEGVHSACHVAVSISLDSIFVKHVLLRILLLCYIYNHLSSLEISQ